MKLQSLGCRTAAARPRLCQQQSQQQQQQWGSSGRRWHRSSWPLPPLRAVEELVTSDAGPSAAEQQQQQEREPTGLQLHQPDQQQPSGKRVAVLQAHKFAAVPVQELGRPLAEYMTLPASQYSVLDAQRIERLDEETFVCYVGGLKFFSFEVEPVITVSVTVQERGPTVRLLSTKLRGSRSVEQANDKFTSTMTNVVRWREAEGSGSGEGRLEICSDTSIRVELEVPGWFIVPTTAIEKTGCKVMETVLATAVPRFLKQLAADYKLWADGDEARRSAAAAAALAATDGSDSGFMEEAPACSLEGCSMSFEEEEGAQQAQQAAAAAAAMVAGSQHGDAAGGSDTDEYASCSLDGCSFSDDAEGAEGAEGSEGADSN